MEQEEKFEVWDGVEVAESPLLRREHSNPYAFFLAAVGSFANTWRISSNRAI